MTQVIRLVWQHGSPEDTGAFLSHPDFQLNHEDRFNLLSEFGMYDKAAKAAFDAKNIEALSTLETICVDREILDSIQRYKAELGSSR